MTVGTLSINGVQVAELESFEITAAYDNDDPTQRPCTCGSMPIRDDRHDAYLCLPCDRWLEKKCRDEGCSYCATRPEKPSEVLRCREIALTAEQKEALTMPKGWAK